MSFQYVIDSAESISINRQKVVASTTSRDGTVRAVSRGGQTWTFEVKLPQGPRWTEWRDKISKIEALGKTTTAQIKLNNLGHLWLSQYQGSANDYSSFTATWVQGATTITLTGGPTLSSGYKFKAGDFIQLGSSGKVYTVAADVAYNSNTVTLHRPILDSNGSGTLKVGPDCTWTVVCTQLPQWTIFARDQITWSGPFVFSEYLL